MIEDGMFLALGFFTAMLIALASVPLLWTRAMRLSRRRLEMLVPLSAKEIEADRDGLRAEAAVVQRRLEQTLERRDQASAELAAELGRRTTGLVAAEQRGEDLRAERASLIAELAALSGQMRDEQAQSGALKKALHDADGRIASALSDAESEAERYAALLSLSEQRRGSIASLETRCAGLGARLADREGDIVRLENQLLDLRLARAALARERDTARNEVLLATTQKDRMENALKDEVARGQMRDQQAAAQAEALAAAEQKIMTKDAQIKRSTQAMAELKRRFDVLQARITTEVPDASNDELEVDRHERALRDAIVAAGDDAVRLLGSRAEPGETPAGEPPSQVALLQEQKR